MEHQWAGLAGIGVRARPRLPEMAIPLWALFFSVGIADMLDGETSPARWRLPLMAKATVIKPAHKAIRTYYQTLQTYRDERVEHEGATETAFQQLLADTARPHGWTLLPKLKLQVKGKNIFPDGTLRDFFNLRRGFWEAKDTHDDLEVEISRKIEKRYPLNTTIFEGTGTGVLFQGGKERYRRNLTDPK